jgi:hypothetical protein
MAGALRYLADHQTFKRVEETSQWIVECGAHYCQLDWKGDIEFHGVVSE